MLSDAGCDVPITCFESATTPSKPSTFGSLSTAAGLRSRKSRYGRDAKVVAVLRLLSVAERVDARRHDLAANLLERAGHANRANERAAFNAAPAGSVAADRLDPPDVERRVADDDLRAGRAASSDAIAGASSAGGFSRSGLTFGCASTSRREYDVQSNDLNRSSQTCGTPGTLNSELSRKTFQRMPSACPERSISCRDPEPLKEWASATPMAECSSVENGLNHCIAPQLGSCFISLLTVSCMLSGTLTST